MSNSALLFAGLDSFDLEGLRSEFETQNEFLHCPQFLPASSTARLDQLARDLLPIVHRSKLGSYKKSGSISSFVLAEHAPELLELYRDERLLAFFGALVGKSLVLCPESDPHACALYYYTEPGDHVGFHYDTSWYRGQRYTVLLGIVNQTEHSKLVCDLFRKDKTRETEHRELSTEPGSLVVFNGDKLWHSVSPLAANEIRVMLTLEYLTDAHMSAPKRWISNFKDAVAYFGFRGVRRRRVLPSS